MNYYTCPVCGFDRMTDAPEDLNICPCCGTEFGTDTYRHSAFELRKHWVKNGMPWFSRYVKKPKGWSGWAQLTKAGFTAGLITPSGAATTTKQRTIVSPINTFPNHLVIVPSGA